MKTRIISAIIMIIIALPILLIGGIPFKFFAVILGLFALYELLKVKETEKVEETLEEFIEETRFEVKPSLWERVKQSKFVQAIKRLTRIRIVIDVPALPEGRGK